MATTAREGANAKEKKAASPSNPQLMKSLKSPSTSSSSSYRISSEKSVPNYLKPTLSSRKDVSIPSKRPSTDTSAQKSLIDRRRSFDRPPSSLHLHKSLIHGTGVTNKPHERTVRSASFTSSTRNPSSSSSRPSLERLAGTAVKDVKPEASIVKAKKKSTSIFTTAAAKKEHVAGSISLKKKDPRSVTSESSVEARDKEFELGNNVVIDQEDDYAQLIDHEVQSLPEISEMPGSEQHLGDPPVEPELKNVEEDNAEPEEEEGGGGHTDGDLVHDQVLHEDIPNAGEMHQSQHQYVDHDHSVEEVVNRHTEDPGESIVKREVKVEEDEDEAQGAEETVAEATEVDHEEEPKEPPVHGEKNQEARVEEAANTGEEKEDEIKETEPMEQGENASIVKQQQQEQDETGGAGGKKEAANTGEEKDDEIKETEPMEQGENAGIVQQQQQEQDETGGAGGKKETAQAYNDVIEETASKLMEKRKNKVKALAGAFETVISLQETK